MATQPAGSRRSLPPPTPDYSARALLIWPGLSRARLASTKGDPHRIARLVARRTNLPHETILWMLGVRPSGGPR